SQDLGERADAHQDVVELVRHRRRELAETGEAARLAELPLQLDAIARRQLLVRRIADLSDPAVIAHLRLQAEKTNLTVVAPDAELDVERAAAPRQLERAPKPVAIVRHGAPEEVVQRDGPRLRRQSEDAI